MMRLLSALHCGVPTLPSYSRLETSFADFCATL
jgi:hypothetical protein